MGAQGWPSVPWSLGKPRQFPAMARYGPQSRFNGGPGDADEKDERISSMVWSHRRSPVGRLAGGAFLAVTHSGRPASSGLGSFHPPVFVTGCATAARVKRLASYTHGRSPSGQVASG